MKNCYRKQGVFFLCICICSRFDLGASFLNGNTIGLIPRCTLFNEPFYTSKTTTTSAVIQPSHRKRNSHDIIIRASRRRQGAVKETTEEIELNPLVSNLLRLCSAGWVIGVFLYVQTLEPGINKVFGFEMSPAAVGLGGLDPDLSSAYAGFFAFLASVDIPVLLLLSFADKTLDDYPTFRRLASGAFIKHFGTLLVFTFGILNGYAGGDQFPTFILLELLTTSAIVSGVVDYGYSINSGLLTEAFKDFSSGFNVSKVGSRSLLSNFYMSGFFLSILVGASFAFSPVSPIAPVDVEETFISQLLRANYGLGLMFIQAPIGIVLSEAATTGTLGRISSRSLNLAYAVLVSIAGLTTLSGRSDSLETASDVFDQVDRFSTNTAAAGCIAILSSLFYFGQALLAKNEDEEVSAS